MSAKNRRSRRNAVNPTNGMNDCRVIEWYWYDGDLPMVLHASFEIIVAKKNSMLSEF